MGQGRFGWACRLAALSLVACGGDIGSGEEQAPAADRPGDEASPGGADSGVAAGSDASDPRTIGDAGRRPDSVTPPVEEVDPNTTPQAELFACDGAPASSPSRIRRIERREWVRATGSSETGYKSSEVARTNPFDAPPAAPYSTWGNGAGIDATTLDLYLGVLADSVTPWMARDMRRTPRTYADAELRCMFEDAAPDDACIDYYLRSLLEDGVLYRPPSEGEWTRMRALTERVLAEEASSGAPRADSLRRVASAAWLQSGALFRRELGEGEPDADGRRRLSDWELAHALALMLSDRPPGAMGTYRFGEGPDGGGWTPADPMEGYLQAIEDAARDGSIQDPEVIRSLVRKYAAGSDPDRFDLNVDFGVDDRAARGEYWVSQKIHHFFQQWLDYEDVALVFKDTPYKTSRYDAAPYTDEDRSSIVSSWSNLLSGYYGHESLLSQQLDDLIARIVVEDSAVLQNLLTTRRAFVASTTARNSSDKSTRNTHRPYNLESDIAATREDRWVELPADERAGVLTHPAFLSAHGGNFEDDASVVHRGKLIRENLLCQSVPGLELVMVEAQLVPSDPDKRARDRIAESIESNAQCTGCHSLMNPLGYPFEIYNHAGFVRADDHGSAPDGSSLLQGMPDPALDGPVRDAVELSEKLADSGHVERCFVRQVFRFFMGRGETRADGCALVAMQEAYDDSGGSFVAMLEALAVSDTFLYRHHEEDP